MNNDPVIKTFIPYGKQYIDEDDIVAVSEVLRGAYITTGPRVEIFERDLCNLTGAKYAVAIANGTAALHAACFAAGIEEGDEVVTTPMTFAASANCILYCGGTPVFADIDPDTWNISADEIEKRVTDRTKAVVAVDFTGQAVDLDRIRDICIRQNLILIEDAAHAIGTKYRDKYVGSIADMTIFSFHPVKTITCGEGGAILTDDENYYRKLLRFRTHGIIHDPKLMRQKPFNGFYEQIELGYNYRLTDFQAALGSSQLKKLDKFSKRRAMIVDIYNRELGKIPELILQKEIPDSKTTRHIYIIRLNKKLLRASRGEFYKSLNEENVGLQVHYIPVYYHPYYQSLGYRKGLCPVAEDLYEDIITIPLYYSLSDEDVYSVIEAVKKTVDKYRK
ncbi:aminotransferase DegT [Desulfosporosinus sp. Tol-M]|nr:aminotransferase DegT [Desulfosporosinus sp. Tol-M]